MALNRENLHLLVLSEDKATSSVAAGFNDSVVGQMQVLPYERGWPNVLNAFKQTLLSRMRQYPKCHLVLLIDFDNDFPDRLNHFKQHFPADVADRVYVLGALGNIEDAKRSTGMKFGELGQQLARECEENQRVIWNDDQIRHNTDEVQRLLGSVRPFLFEAP